jgi:hypothetical protein
MRKRSAGRVSWAILAVAIFAILASNVAALAESLWWTPSTTSADGLYTFTPAEMATMTFYVRIDQANPRDLTGSSGWYYVGETRNGVLSWPADNSLASLMRSYGLGAKTVRFTVSQAFKGADGIERDSEFAVPISWVVPPVVVPPPPSPACKPPTALAIR